MKKANIILSAIGLLSVIGGALAFKAQHRFNASLACYTSAHKVTTPTIYTTNGTIANSPTLLCTIPNGSFGYTTNKVTIAL